jgi:RNA polymerase sigma-70 factor (ECF subfamily)
MIFSPSEFRRLIHVETRRTGNPIYDEDLAQEAALRALDAFRRAGEVKHPHAFLRKIVCDTVRDHWRHRQRPTEDIDAVDERLLSVQPQFEADLDRRRQRMALTSALNRLDAAKRTLITMFYEEGVSIPEIARRHDSTISAVKMQLLRARQELFRMLGAGEKARDSSDKKSRSVRTSRQSRSSSR